MSWRSFRFVSSMVREARYAKAQEMLDLPHEDYLYGVQVAECGLPSRWAGEGWRVGADLRPFPAMVGPVRLAFASSGAARSDSIVCVYGWVLRW